MRENVQFIGKINTKMFELIAKNIITDEVIITEKQRLHIDERHPGILSKYEKHIKIMELLFTKVNKNAIIKVQ